MSFLIFCQWLQDTALSTGIRESVWVFPVIEGTHVLALTLSVGLIAAIDLRLFGVVLRRVPASELSKQLLPWAMAGFAVMFITGILLFVSLPMKCYESILFTIKMSFLALAAVNAFVFHITIYRSMSKWDNDAVPPLGARLAGLLSLILWMGVIVAGRNMAYRF